MSGLETVLARGGGDFVVSGVLVGLNTGTAHRPWYKTVAMSFGANECRVIGCDQEAIFAM